MCRGWMAESVVCLLPALRLYPVAEKDPAEESLQPELGFGKNPLGVCDDDLEQKNLRVGLRWLQVFRLDPVTPEGQEPWAARRGNT